MEAELTSVIDSWGNHNHDRKWYSETDNGTSNGDGSVTGIIVDRPHNIVTRLCRYLGRRLHIFKRNLPNATIHAIANREYTEKAQIKIFTVERKVEDGFRHFKFTQKIPLEIRRYRDTRDQSCSSCSKKHAVA